ncbi:hypothetical protein PR003_g32038 [Phytophthora rubi]|uniref:Uncharacterized protein n=1 Tax=Phytophthora rubi TaxID=129364 RepID=A0A6A4B594_9STRA|nr:hypothetical protein PR003_g32038 [Phytophthora rubi]
MWRELREQGWTRKPPPRRELDDRYFYLRPGGDARVTTASISSVVKKLCWILRRKTRTPAPTRASNAPAPGNAQVAAAAEVVRLDYLRDIWKKRHARQFLELHLDPRKS